MSRSFTAAIVGLGQVGQGYDYESKDSSLILTHASAFALHTGFRLVAGVDVDQTNRERFAAKFGINVFEDCTALKRDINHVDVVSIAVPTDLHLDVFKKVLELRPLVICCEKPIAATLSDAYEMATMASDAQCALVVNYTRRFNPQIQHLRGLIRDGAIGKIYKGFGWYTKGIVHCGSHFIDLLIDFLGKPDDVKILAKGRRWEGRDPEPDILLTFDEAIIYLLSGREESFSMGEIELIGTKGRFTFRDGDPLRLYRAHTDPIFSGYYCLGLPDIFDSMSEKSMYFTAQNIYDYLTKGVRPLSDALTATATLGVVESIMRKIEGAYE